MRYTWLGYLGRLEGYDNKPIPLSDLTEIKYTDQVSAFEQPWQAQVKMGVWEAGDKSWQGKVIDVMPPVIYLNSKWEGINVLYWPKYGYLQVFRPPDLKNASAKIKRRHYTIVHALVDIHMLGGNIDDVYAVAKTDALANIAKYAEDAPTLL